MITDRERRLGRHQLGALYTVGGHTHSAARSDRRAAIESAVGSSLREEVRVGSTAI